LGLPAALAAVQGRVALRRERLLLVPGIVSLAAPRSAMAGRLHGQQPGFRWFFHLDPASTTTVIVC